MTMTTRFFRVQFCFGYLLLLWFVVHVVVYLHDNLFVCLLCYLLVSIGRSVNQPIAALSCCMTPAGAGSECAVPDLSKYCHRFNKCCIHRGGSLLIAKPELQGGTRWRGLILGKNQSCAKCVNMSSISGWPDPGTVCVCVCLLFCCGQKGYA